MTLLNHLLLVASLAALSLAACTSDYECADSQCELDPQSDDRSDNEAEGAEDLVRIEIEVVGTGTVIVDADEPLECTGDQGLCSFSYMRGTPVAIYAADELGENPSWEDACEGHGPCYITLDADEVVVADFN